MESPVFDALKSFDLTLHKGKEVSEMTVQEVKDYFRIESVHAFTNENIAEALTGNYDCLIIVNKDPHNNHVAFMAMVHENEIVSIYVDEKNCSRETLDDFCVKYKIVR